MSRALEKNEIRNRLDEIFENTEWGQKFATAHLDSGIKVEGREILLPLSPSDNRRLQPTRQGRLVNGFEYRAWLVRAVRALKKFQLMAYPKEVPLYVWTLVVLPDHRRDHHNFQKALYDAFEQSESVLTNDRQIVERHTKGIVIKGFAFTLSYVFPVSTKLPIIEVSDEQIADVTERIINGRGSFFAR